MKACQALNNITDKIVGVCRAENKQKIWRQSCQDEEAQEGGMASIACSLSQRAGVRRRRRAASLTGGLILLPAILSLWHLQPERKQCGLKLEGRTSIKNLKN